MASHIRPQPSRDEGLDSLPDVNPISVRIGEHERAQAVVSVAHRFDDARALGNQVVVQHGRVVHEQMGDVAIARAVLLAELQVKLGGVARNDGETYRLPVLERLRHAENVDVEGEGTRHVGHGQGRGDATELRRRMGHEGLAGFDIVSMVSGAFACALGK